MPSPRPRQPKPRPADGPVASQEAIKELGTNGGGFFNGTQLTPYENPNPLTNLLEMLAILSFRWPSPIRLARWLAIRARAGR